MERLKIFLSFLFCLLLSCRTNKPPESETLEDQSAPTLPAQDEPPPPPSQQDLLEPNGRELNRLPVWLAEQETGFDIERLEDCEAQLLLRGDRIQKKSDIQRAADELQSDVKDSLALYHWCYFHMLSRLEYQLEQQNLGRSYQDKLQQFLRETKALFIVAECLDRARQARSYRSNLQKKYMQLSQAFFGRSLSPLETSSQAEPKKPAAPFVEK